MNNFIRKNINIIISTFVAIFAAMLFYFSFSNMEFSFKILNFMLWSIILIWFLSAFFRIVLDIQKLDEKGWWENSLYIFLTWAVILINMWIFYINFN